MRGSPLSEGREGGRRGNGGGVARVGGITIIRRRAEVSHDHRGLERLLDWIAATPQEIGPLTRMIALSLCVHFIYPTVRFGYVTAPID